MATVISPLPVRIIHRSQIRSGVTAGSRPPQVLSAPPLETPTAPAPVEPTPAPLAVAASGAVHVVDHPAAQHALTVLHDKATEAYDFRAASNQLLVLLAVEATRSLPLKAAGEPTRGNRGPARSLAKSVVFLSITRDGLGLSHNLVDCLPGLLLGGISLERPEGGQRQARLHLASAPALSDSRVILFDPMVGSGASAATALNLVHRLGATDVSLLSYVVSAAGLERLRQEFSRLSIWTAEVDEQWDIRRGSAAPFANFGSRLFT